MFRKVPLSIIRSLFTLHSAMVYVIQVCRQLSSRTRSCSKAVYKPVWHIPLLSVKWINPWWWTEELSETCRVSCQNKVVKLVHIVGFITKKFVTLHGHMNVRYTVSYHYIKHCALLCEKAIICLWRVIFPLEWNAHTHDTKDMYNQRDSLISWYKFILSQWIM